jgi:cardiolipin synthase
LAVEQLPNIITVLRIALVVPTAVLLWQADYVDALVLVFIAGVSDALDGTLARRFGWVTRFGAAMDPVADKLLVLVTFVIFFIQGHIPAWLAAVIVTRDVVIIGGAFTYRVWFHEIEFAPTYLSKVNTAVQIVLLIAMLVALCEFGEFSNLLTFMIDPWGFWLLAILTGSSGLHYVVTWGRKAWLNKHPAT